MGGSPPSDDGAPETYHRGRKSRKRALALLSATAVLALAFVRWRPTRLEVQGRSMHPTLEPGDWAIAIRARLVRPGDVVVLEHPARPEVELVKRVTAVGGDIAGDGEPLRAGEIWIEGDAPLGSTDSRSLGPARLADVRGRVILVWWPPRRWRRV